MTVFTKPPLWCLFVHQIAWDDDDVYENVYHCPYCRSSFLYPTRQQDEPRYK